MAYKPLKKVEYMKYGSSDEEYEKRRTSYGTINTEMYPYLMDRGVVKGKKYPLFVVPLLEIQVLMQEIQDKSKTIQMLADSLPNVAKEQFYREQLYKAVVNTNEIEGIRTTRKEVSDALDALLNKHSRQIRLFSTVRMYYDTLLNSTLKIENLETIREIYDELTEGEIEKGNDLDGVLFRNNRVEIVDEKSGKIEHIPPKEEKDIVIQLSNWLTFINSSEVPFLIKAFLAHYFFENIHPFYDGNGRTGRYILSRYLSRKLDIYSGLAISQKINENKKKYYDAFSITGDFKNRAEGTFFVLNMLELLRDGQADIIGFLTYKKSILDSFVEYMADSKNFTEIEKEVLHLVFQSTIFVDDPKDGIKDREIVEMLSANYPKKTLKDTIKSLNRQGYIHQTSKSPSRHILNEVAFGE